MGSTYSAAKRVEAIRGDDGRYYYALYESTYESNVFPQRPSWSAIYFGPVEACMDRIIRLSTACEGGMLKERNGNVTPSAYIKHWREAFLTPYPLMARTLTCSIGNSLYRCSEADIRAVADILSRHEISVIGQSISFVLPRHAQAFYEAVTRGLFPWRFLGSPGLRQTEIDTKAIHAPRKVAAQIPPIPVFSLTLMPFGTIYFYLNSRGNFVRSGPDYRLIADLIEEVAIPAEVSSPGSAESAIREIRKRLASATQMPPTQVVRIHLPLVLSTWAAESHENFANALGIPLRTLIETTVADIQGAEDAGRYFAYLQDATIRFPGISQAASDPPGRPSSFAHAA